MSPISKKKEEFEAKLDPALVDPELGYDPGSIEYDNEFFKDEFATVDDLSKEEIDEKLGALAAKMDKNGDGEITQEELTMWIHYVQTKYIYDDTEMVMEKLPKKN